MWVKRRGTWSQDRRKKNPVVVHRGTQTVPDLEITSIVQACLNRAWGFWLPVAGMALTRVMGRLERPGLGWCHFSETYHQV